MPRWETDSGSAERELAELTRVEATAFDPWQRLDYRVAAGHLRIERWELGSTHGPRGNPTWYTGEAIFGLLSLFLTRFAPVDDRIAAAVDRLEATGRFLAEGRAAVRRAPWEWTARAIRECGAALTLLSDGVDLLMHDEGFESPALRRSADRARVEFGRHRQALEADLGRHRTTDWACGEDALARLLTDAHFLDTSADDLCAYAESELALATSRLQEGAAALGAVTPGVALKRLTAIHPPLDRYLVRYRELWDEVRALAEARELVTWPPLSIRYLPRPRWVRAAAPDLYFLFYRSPAAFGAPPSTTIWSHRSSRASSPSSARLATGHQRERDQAQPCVHHGAIGHHLQNWHASRSTSLDRPDRGRGLRITDRAVPAGGTMAEGWACYATDLMDEFGFLTPLERLAERQTRRRMCARAVVDIRLTRAISHSTRRPASTSGRPACTPKPPGAKR